MLFTDGGTGSSKVIMRLDTSLLPWLKRRADYQPWSYAEAFPYGARFDPEGILDQL